MCHTPTCRECYIVQSLSLCYITGCQRPTGCARVTFRGCAFANCTRGLCDVHGLAVCITHAPGKELCGKHWLHVGACLPCTPKPNERTVQQLLDELGVPNGTLELTQ